MNPHTATLDELRDWLACDDGPDKHAHGWWRSHQGDHPYPPTLDGARKVNP